MFIILHSYKYSYMSYYIILISISLLPSDINSISLRLIISRKNLAFSGSAPYSKNS